MRFKERYEAVIAASDSGGGNHDGGPSNQFSNQADKLGTHFDQYHNEIPEQAKGGPDYSGDQYAGTNDKTHPKNG